MLEMYLADTAPEPAISTPQNLEAQAAVLGAGPLGLSTAYFLGRMGVSVTVCDPLEQPGGFLSSIDNDKLPKKILGRETNRLISLANIQLKLGEDYSALDSSSLNQDWRLIIHDPTAHGKDSGPAKSLAMLSNRLSPGRLLLDTDGIGPRDAYKASQIAKAIAAGRELAAQALSLLGFVQQSDALKGLINSGQTEGSVGDFRYEMFDRQDSACAGLKGQTLSHEQALAEAKRCLSCGHCNLCGRCLMFCPDVSLSINKQSLKLEVDEFHCKGCGICAYECPRRAITMER
jgi:Pyruvate/2-oxoacid:ferredoxin oxidoreductase delta subunit